METKIRQNKGNLCQNWDKIEAKLSKFSKIKKKKWRNWQNWDNYTTKLKESWEKIDTIQ